MTVCLAVIGVKWKCRLCLSSDADELEDEDGREDDELIDTDIDEEVYDGAFVGTNLEVIMTDSESTSADLDSDSKSTSEGESQGKKDIDEDVNMENETWSELIMFLLVTSLKLVDIVDNSVWPYAKSSSFVSIYMIVLE